MSSFNCHRWLVDTLASTDPEYFRHGGKIRWREDLTGGQEDKPFQLLARSGDMTMDVTMIINNYAVENRIL